MKSSYELKNNTNNTSIKPLVISKMNLNKNIAKLGFKGNLKSQAFNEWSNSMIENIKATCNFDPKIINNKLRNVSHGKLNKIIKKNELSQEVMKVKLK